MIRKILAHMVLIAAITLGPVHAQDKKGPSRTSDLDPDDLEVIAIMEILKLMDLAKEMELIKEMEHLVEESQNEPTTD